MSHIEIAKLESRIWTCRVKSAGSPLDLTGCTINFTVKPEPTGSALFTLNNTFGVTFTNTTGGVFSLRLHSTATQSVSDSNVNARYKFEHRIKLSDGNYKVLEFGDFVVRPSLCGTW